MFCAALVCFIVLFVLASGEVFGFRARDTIGRDLLERLIFGSAIVGMIALEVLFYCWRRLHVHNSVIKGDFPHAQGLLIMLMLFLGFFIVMAIRSFQNRWTE